MSSAWTLGELLARCERDELQPLCAILRVNPEGLGQGQLVDVLARTLRRAGGHGVANIVRRKGEGPEYERLLASLCKREGVEVFADVEATELALAGALAARSWGKLTEAQRREAWTLMGLSGPPPDDGAAAITAAETQLGPRYGYKLMRSLAVGSGMALLALPLLSLAGPVGCLGTLFVLGKPDQAQLAPAILEIARLRQLVRHRVTIGIVGSPSAGKDAAIRALFGLDTGGVHPVAGSTREVAVLRVPDSLLTVVNTPGLGDVVESVTEEARKILDHVDVYLYLVNAQGGVQAREKADWSGIRATGRPALAIVNKIDTIRDEDRARYLEDARQKLGVDEANFRAVAFDPLPQLADTPLGVEGVRAWIREKLDEMGKAVGELGG